MKRFTARQDVEPGLYFDRRHLAFRSLEEPGPLPGEPGDTLYRVPVLALLVAGPVLGLAYVVFLPLIGLLMVGWMAAGKAAEWTAEGVTALVRVVRPSWQPTMAFLHRRRPARPGASRKDDWADRVERELDGDER